MAKKSSKQTRKATRSTGTRKAAATARRSVPKLRGPAGDLPDYVLAQVFGRTAAQTPTRGKKTGAARAGVSS